jgi:predicted PurR-regulated permease PerM
LAGVVVVGVPALLFAAGTLDLWRVAVVIALVIALQLFEALVVRRRVDGRTLHVGPALPLIVALIGWDIYGLGGAIYGVLLLILAFAFAVNIESGEPPTFPEPVSPASPLRPGCSVYEVEPGLFELVKRIPPREGTD